MRQSLTLLTGLSTVAAVGASPLLAKKADYDPLPGGDATILNYALTLEYLERKFYSEGLSNYTADDFKSLGLDDSFYADLTEISYDEQSHVDFLSGALGDSAIPEPTFSFPSTDAKSFLALSSVLEGVGVSAYLGAAAVIADKAYVPVAGSILTVEARHSSYIRKALGQSPFPKPYDTPLDFNQVYSLAAQFITGFAEGTPDLPFKAFPPLMVSPGDEMVVAGKSSVTFPGAHKAAMMENKKYPTHQAPVYAVLFSGLDTYYSEVRADGDDYVLDVVPAGDGEMKMGPSGQTYVVLSTADGSGNSKVSDENTISGVGILEVYKEGAEYPTHGSGIKIDIL